MFLKDVTLSPRWWTHQIYDQSLRINGPNFKAGLGHLCLAASLFIGEDPRHGPVQPFGNREASVYPLEAIRLFGPSSRLLGPFINLLKER